MSSEIDAQDRALLALVQQDARMTAEAMGDEVGLSVASVHRRLKRLRSSGIIRREVALLDGKRLGNSMTFIVSVEIERERTDLLDAFRRQMRTFSEVQQCYYITGEADFVLIVKVRDLEHYERFTARAFFDNANVRKFKTSVVLSEVKAGLAIPVSE